MFTAQIVHVVELFANPFHIEAPSYQRSFAWTPKEAGQLLDDVSLALDEAEAGADGQYFLGTMLFIDREGAAAAPSRLSWRARPSRPLEVIDGFQRLTTLTMLLCCLRDIDGGADRPANARLLSAIQVAPGAGARPRLALRETEDKFFVAHVRAARRHARGGKSGRPFAVGRAHHRGARPYPVRARRPRPRRAPQARRFPSRPVLRGAGRHHRHRSRSPHVHGAQHHRQVAGAQGHYQGLHARQRCAGGGGALPGGVERGGDAPGGRVREPVQPHTLHVRPPRRPDHRRHSRDRRERRRAGLHREGAGTVGAHRRRDTPRASQRIAAFARHLPVSTLSRLALVCRLEAGGADVVDQVRR